MNSKNKILNLQAVKGKETNKLYGLSSWVGVVCLTFPSLISTTCL